MGDGSWKEILVNKCLMSPNGLQCDPAANNQLGVGVWGGGVGVWEGSVQLDGSWYNEGQQDKRLTLVGVLLAGCSVDVERANAR